VLCAAFVSLHLRLVIFCWNEIGKKDDWLWNVSEIDYSSSNNVANDNENSIDDKENETTNVITDENEKEKDYEKLMEVYENRKKTGGLSESLTNELKNRKRKQQRHRNKSREYRDRLLMTSQG